jgi:hypothetical protein
MIKISEKGHSTTESEDTTMEGIKSFILYVICSVASKIVPFTACWAIWHNPIA